MYQSAGIPPAPTDEAHAQLHELWQRVAGFPAGKSTEAILAFMHGLCRILEAHDACWLAVKEIPSSPKKNAAHLAVHKLLDGWIPVSAVYANRQKNLNSLIGRWYRHVKREGLDPSTQYLQKTRGKTRVVISDDFCTREEWKSGWVATKYLSTFGLSERILSIFALDQATESYIILDREVGAPPFTESERNLLYLAITGIEKLHRMLMLERGFIHSTAPLSQREQETFGYLLTDLSEGEIADQMGLSS
ncbi:MAG: hypothetical protein ACPG6P_13915, partial [Akkermansiaceae bacterium]